MSYVLHQICTITVLSFPFAAACLSFLPQFKAKTAILPRAMSSKRTTFAQLISFLLLLTTMPIEVTAVL